MIIMILLLIFVNLTNATINLLVVLAKMSMQFYHKLKAAGSKKSLTVHAISIQSESECSSPNPNRMPGEDTISSVKQSETKSFDVDRTSNNFIQPFRFVRKSTNSAISTFHDP